MTTNQPDQARQHALQDEIDELGNVLDPIDLHTVLTMIWDADDPGISFPEWLNASLIAREMIKYSQSNPERSIAAMLRMNEIDDELGSL